MLHRRELEGQVLDMYIFLEHGGPMVLQVVLHDIESQSIADALCIYK